MTLIRYNYQADLTPIEEFLAGQWFYCHPPSGNIDVSSERTLFQMIEPERGDYCKVYNPLLHREETLEGWRQGILVDVEIIVKEFGANAEDERNNLV